MKTIILGDTHFGVKNNSLTWLKYQLKGLDEVIEYVRANPGYTIIHCGDLFDSRSTFNLYTVARVQDKLNELSQYVEHLYVIGGNHDYYSPVDSEDNVSMMTLLHTSDNITLVTKDELYIDDICLVPWFVIHDRTRLQSIIDRNPKYIYTHTDMNDTTLEVYDLLQSYKGTIISGHIHTPCIRDRRIGVGSLFPINFSDVNSERGFYILDDKLEFHPLVSPIKFYRIYDVLNFDPEQLKFCDQVEVLVDGESYTHEDVLRAIGDISTKCSMRVIITYKSLEPIENEGDIDIEEIVRTSIPDYLQSKFEEVLAYE